MINLNLTKFTESHAREICNWKYDGEYSVYNYPDWDTALKNNYSIVKKEKSYPLKSVPLTKEPLNVTRNVDLR